MADDPPLINLKVLSPSTEMESGVTLPDLPASITVKDLRLRIQQAVPAQPAVERMRLIYRGRVVASDTDTLADVFGLDNIRNSKEQTLHLVLRELPTSTSSTPIPRSTSSPAPRSSTAPPNPFRPAQTPPQAPPLPTNPFRTIGQPRTNAQPQGPHPHYHQQRHPAHHPAFGPLPLPQEVNNLFQHQIAQAMAHNLPNNNAQGRQSPAQQSRNGTPAPEEGGEQPAPTGLRPMMTAGPTNTTTIRREAIGPNGERWTMTTVNTNLAISGLPHGQPILPRPFPHPPHFPGPVRPPGPVDDNLNTILNRARNGLLAARQEMDNVRILLQVPNGAPVRGSLAAHAPPSWRIERIRQHARNLEENLDQVQQGLSSILGEPTWAQDREVVSLQEDASELRARAQDLNATLDTLQSEMTSNQAPAGQNMSSILTPTISGTEATTTAPQSQSWQAGSRPSLAETGPELFLLSSPQGPVGILFDQRGTYSTAPLISTLPFQPFSQQFSSNRQIFASLGQQMAQNSINLHNHLATAQPPQNNPATANAQPQPDQQAAQNQNQNENQPQNQVQNPAQENDRLANIAGHLWLLFKLACFIYIFAGGGGWYRPVMMGIVGALVYLAQTGIFDEPFNRIRQHFENFLPHLDGAARPLNNQNGQARNQNANGRPGPADGPRRTEPDRNLTPEEAARRLMNDHHQQRFGWVRERSRAVERAFAIFVASLWPGLGERMVQAQEERVRAERAAEEERLRQEEEARQRAEQERAERNAESSNREKGEPKVEGQAEGSSSKGKEKVEVAEEGS